MSIISLTAEGGIVANGESQDFIEYEDRSCDNLFPCKVNFPNTYTECFSITEFEARQEKGRLRQRGTRTAYLPAITSCQQYLYLPSEKSN